MPKIEFRPPFWSVLYPASVKLPKGDFKGVKNSPHKQKKFCYSRKTQGNTW